MGEDFEPLAEQSQNIRPVSHERILVIMAALGAVGGIAGFAFSSLRFGLGILVGTGLAFVNYYWLKNSLRKIFAAAQTGERPRMLAGKYFLRYVVLAIVVAVIYAADLLSIVGLILGLGAFGFAVVIEGVIRIFSKP
jgi:hypothetical protein